MNFKLIVTSVLMGALLSANQLVHADIEDNSKPLVMAQATPEVEQEHSLKTSVKKADFIFQGVVTKIEYRLSDKTPKLPHSFVTFKVEKFLKGEFNQQSITLRFVGGTDNRGNFLSVSGVPLFDVGDRDILLVKGNGKSGCPLVGCEAGRFRIIKNQIFTEDGQLILLNDQNELAYGKTLPLEEVVTNKIGQTVIRDVSSNESENEGDSRDLSLERGVDQSQEELVSLPSLAPSKLELLIKNQVIQLATSREVQAQQFVVSVDSQEEFFIAPAKPLSPPRIATPRSESPKTSSAADRREMEMLEQNGGNPVLPNSKP